MTKQIFGGRDCELSTTGVDARGNTIDAWKVTGKVLEQITPTLAEQGVRAWSRQTPAHGGGYGYSPYSMDCLRHWTSAGQCYYADMSHAEVCTASTLHPATFSAQCISTLLVAEAARKRAELAAENGDRYSLSASNADMLDPAVSFGTHVSFSVTSSLWEELFIEQRHPAVLGFVSSAIAAAIAFFGNGYLLPFKDGTTIYSLSARAHHLSKIKTLSTTEAFARGLLNTRREPHGKDHDRLHLIGFDYCLLSSALMFSYLQCVLAAAEESFCGMNLFDPVRALRSWSWGMVPETGKLPATAQLIDGRQLTLPAYMRELSSVLLRMCEGGLITPYVSPQVAQMLPHLIELTRYAEEGSIMRCAPHLTWAAKLLWLTQLCAGGATLGDAQTRLADHDFSDTDPEKGTLWRLWKQGLVDPLVALSDAESCMREPPVESRDWGRGKLLSRFFDQVLDVDWSYLELRSAPGRWSPRVRIDMPHLDSLNKQQFTAAMCSTTEPRQLAELLAENGDASAQETNPLDDVPRHLAVIPRDRAAASDFDSES